MSDSEHFSVPDYCIFGVTIIVSLGIGLFHALSGGKQRTTAEYFLGNRKMNFLPLAISLLVTNESSIFILGAPAEVYVYGLQSMVEVFGFSLAVVITTFVFVPVLHPLRITSSYEYLELRFKSRAVRTLGSALSIALYTVYNGIVLFGPAIALEGVKGFPQWGSILFVGLASVIYTSLGGLKAVIWTDVFQFVVMFVGMFAVMIKGTNQIGGVQKTWERAYDKGRVNLFNFDPDPTVRHTFWCLFFGAFMRGSSFIFYQNSVQRISSTPTIKDAKRVTLYVAPGMIITMLLAGIEGIIVYAYYDFKRCDPLTSKQISNPNQIVPFMVMDLFQNLNGMTGLFMASLFSASLSTLSSNLSNVSALFWTDFVKPHAKPMSELNATVISKISVFVFGALTILVAFMVDLIGGTLIQITGSLLSAFGGPFSGLFLVAVFCPFVNSKGAFVGCLLSAIVSFCICIGQMTTKGAVKNTRLPSAPVDFCPTFNSSFLSDLDENYTGIYSSVNNGTTTTTLGTVSTGDFVEPTGLSRLFMVSYQWFGAIGILQVFVYATIISWFTGFTKPEDIDRRTVVSFYDAFFPFLPDCIRKPLRCGYDAVYNPISRENGNNETMETYELTTNAIMKQPETVHKTLLADNDKGGQDMILEVMKTAENMVIPATNNEDKVTLSDALL